MCGIAGFPGPRFCRREELVFIHPSADVRTHLIGEGTRVWQSCVILPGAVLGRDCNINAHCLIEGGAVVGDRVTLKCGVYVWAGVELADDVFVGPNATFTNDGAPRSGRKPASFATTRVEKGASVGAAAVLVAPVVVGRYALIGAGAVVTRDVPPYALVVGNPAHQVAWVCACGDRLVAPWTCAACGRSFEMKNDTLVPKDDSSCDMGSRPSRNQRGAPRRSILPANPPIASMLPASGNGFVSGLMEPYEHTLSLCPQATRRACEGWCAGKAGRAVVER
jgi:UDP-2-acetamido-3-amino-2,3-dideoxy-glucuronate N-acetyltransferase